MFFSPDSAAPEPDRFRGGIFVTSVFPFHILAQEEKDFFPTINLMMKQSDALMILIIRRCLV